MDLIAYIDSILTTSEEWERFADEYGSQIDLDEYRPGDGTGEDDFGDFAPPSDWGMTDYDNVIGREIAAGWGNKERTYIVVSAINTGACGNNYAAKAWNIDLIDIPNWVKEAAKDS